MIIRFYKYLVGFSERSVDHLQTVLSKYNWYHLQLDIDTCPEIVSYSKFELLVTYDFRIDITYIRFLCSSINTKYHLVLLVKQRKWLPTQEDVSIVCRENRELVLLWLRQVDKSRLVRNNFVGYN